MATTPPPIRPFHGGFETEPLTPTDRAVTCPPVLSSTQLSAQARHSYATLPPNDARYWGMTGLLVMERIYSQCYGSVVPGQIFLFPGTYETNAPPYIGTVSIDCADHPAMYGSRDNPLHRQMCELLRQRPKSFIGFSLTYPWFVDGGVGYNSGVCNPPWFRSRTIPIDCNGVNWQQILYNALAMWPAQEDIFYDSGSQNSVALDSNGNAVEVHVGTGRLYYHVGQVGRGSELTWGPSLQYDTGNTNAVSMDDNGNVVEVHSSGTDLYYCVGRADFSKKSITFTAAKKYAQGSSNAVALQPDGLVVATGVRGTDLYYHVGIADFSAKKIDFGSEMKYDTGGATAVALQGNGTVVEVHVGTDRLYYLVGQVNASTRQIKFGISTQYGTGTFNAVGVNATGTVVEAHVEPDGLYYRLGTVNSAAGSISFGPNTRYDEGDRCAVAVNGRGGVAEVDTWRGGLYSRAGLML